MTLEYLVASFRQGSKETEEVRELRFGELSFLQFLNRDEMEVGGSR